MKLVVARAKRQVLLIEAQLPVTSQIFVHECDGHASLTNGRRNSLDGAQPNVATSKNTRGTRFKEVRIAAV